MLHSLKAENLALIESAELDLRDGFVCLTGETGAGKSLMIDALNLLKGVRSSSELVRTGCEKAIVEAVFSVSAQPSGFDLLENDDLFLRREITAEGRSRAFVNGAAVPNSVLQAYAALAFELFGQGGQHQLLSETHQLELFDRSMGLSAKVAQFHKAKSAFLQRWNLYWDQVDGERERLREMDALRMQVNEIDEVQPTPADDELELRLKRSRNTDEIRLRAASACNVIEENMASALTRLVRDVTFISEFQTSLQPYVEQLTAARETINELVRDLVDLNHEDAVSELADLESRFNDLNRLFLKYGRDVTEVLAERNLLQERLQTLEQQSQDLPREWQALQAVYAQLMDERDKLHRLRRAACDKFAKRVASELTDLAFPAAAFSVNYQWQAWPTNLDQTRQLELKTARLAFLFSPNPGETPRSLGRIASGGELSRVLLAVICAFERHDPITMIFDEVDAGIGGETAVHVGRKLARLGSQCQVVCVTHLAQVASKAGQHLVIEKQVEGQRTRTRVSERSGPDRIRELARLMGGDADSAALQEHATAMLESG